MHDDYRKYENHDRKLSLRDAINRLFDDSFWVPIDSSIRRSVSTYPSVDISETDDVVVVHANIPGVDPEKINLEIKNDLLTISGEREREEEENRKRFYRYEREYGTFSRTVRLPSRVEEDGTEASVRNGVLTITMKKIIEPKKKIPIKVL